MIAACGGGATNPPPESSYTLTVNSANPSSGVTVGVSVQGSNAIANETTPFTRTVASGNTMVLSASGTAPNGNPFSAWTGCTSVSAAVCTETVTGNTTVTAGYTALIVPTLTVTPFANSITTSQSLSVTVAVAGGTGNATPTGSVTLTSGSYTSSAATLSSGSATINILAGSLATGTDTLTVNYTPDSASSGTFSSASGTASVTVAAPAGLVTPTVTVTPSASSITASQALSVAVSVAGGSGAATPTGSVTLSSGSFASSPSTLSSGSATINIPAGSLSTGTDTLTVTYAPDANSAGTYQSVSGTASVTVTAAAATTYVLTVDSTAPASGISITVSPADNNGAGTGTTPFTRTYNANANVTLTAPISSGGYSFVSWNGCSSTPSASVCNVTMNANTIVSAVFNQTGVTSVSVSPGTATIGTQQQFTATVNGYGTFSKTVTWTVSCTSCGNLSSGTISASGLYNTPYPAPPSVTITATSTANPSISGSATVTLSPPATTTGPALSVDAGNKTHSISPYIYGMNAYSLNATTAKAVNLPVDRWGGDATSRYNYKLDVSSSASDYYFENFTQATGVQATSGFNAQVSSDAV